MARGMFLVQGDRGAVTSWLVHSTLDQPVWVQALARDIVLSFRASQFTCSAFLHSTQVYKWVLANQIGTLCMMVTARTMLSKNVFLFYFEILHLIGTIQCVCRYYNLPLLNVL